MKNSETVKVGQRWQRNCLLFDILEVTDKEVKVQYLNVGLGIQTVPKSYFDEKTDVLSYCRRLH